MCATGALRSGTQRSGVQRGVAHESVTGVARSSEHDTGAMTPNNVHPQIMFQQECRDGVFSVCLKVSNLVRLHFFDLLFD